MSTESSFWLDVSPHIYMSRCKLLLNYRNSKRKATDSDEVSWGQVRGDLRTYDEVRDDTCKGGHSSS